MKKLAAFFLTAILLLCLASGAYAFDYKGEATPSSVLLMDPDSGSTLYEKNADARVWPASTTKIMTALIVLERTDDLHETVTVDADALDGLVEGVYSTLEPMLRAEEQLTVEQLLYGLMLVSGNDCAAALAIHTAGSVDAFAVLMNERAGELGMTSTHFVNPHGIQDDDHYTTARDMSRLALAAMENEEFMRIVGTAEYDLPATNMASARHLQTTNRLLLGQADIPGTVYLETTGIKTGSTPSAGGCLVSSAERDGHRALCLVYGDGSPDERDRWFLSKTLLSAALDELSPPAQTETPSEESAVPEAAPVRHNGAARIVWSVLSVAVGMLLLFILYNTVSRLNYYLRRSRRRPSPQRLRRAMTTPAVVLAILLVAEIICIHKASSAKETSPANVSAAFEAQTVEEDAQAPEATPEAAVFAPAAVSASAPSNWGVSWAVMENGQTVSSFARAEPIRFGDGADYFPLPGVGTFRGGNYRDGGSYGVAELQEGSISTLWSVDTGVLTTGSGASAWTGSGWTGQPLIVQWDSATRSNMNLYEAKKNKDDLVEVVYATLDGHIYFLDLDDGSYTRDPVDLGMCFKGAGALDPRGWPLMYVGSGDETVDGKRPRMFIVSLIDGSILYEYGYDEEFSLRQDNDRWCAFDSSPLVDAKTDTLIWPGESGVLYTIKLNTSYDAAAGAISISPDEPVKARYDTDRSSEEKYWYGYECSAVIVDRYIYLSENGGMFFCVDLDTMELVWAQDTRDDSNACPVYEPDGEEHGYLYTAPSLHWTQDENAQGTIYIYKLDAITGEIVWSRGYDCYTVDGVSGGVQSSPVLGRAGTELEGLVIYSVSRCPDIAGGRLVALDTRTGSEVWSYSLDYYAWSSPLALYGADGSAAVLLCDSGGRALLIDGATGERITSAELGSLIEASPAAYNSTFVVGTRGQKIYGMRVR